MPEQLTKHPEVTLQVLRSAGAKCAENAPQAILTQCPAERFCKLPGGEICVYGLPQARNMTQITAADWRALLQSLDNKTGSSALGADGLAGAGIGITAGLLAALAFRRARR
ncbi:hypothetical protein [Caldimonas sp. KR1-144]|uniref:hypothetical protein n=1 Tax=Caldimonas sp. KR1-144 TaxID=3400911 RepID=UPI003C0570C7